MNRKFPRPLPRLAYVSHVVHHFLKRQNSVEYAAQVKIALSSPIPQQHQPPQPTHSEGLPVVRGSIIRHRTILRHLWNTFTIHASRIACISTTSRENLQQLRKTHQGNDKILWSLRNGCWFKIIFFSDSSIQATRNFLCQFF